MHQEQPLVQPVEKYDFSTSITFNPGQTSSLLYRLLRGRVEMGIDNVKTLNYEDLSEQDIQTLKTGFPWIRIVHNQDKTNKIEADVEGIKRQFKQNKEVTKELFYILNETFKQFPGRFASFNFALKKFPDDTSKLDTSLSKINESIMEIAQSITFLDALVDVVKLYKAEYAEEIKVLSEYLQNLLTSMQGVIIYLGESKKGRKFLGVHQSVARLMEQLVA